MSDAICICPLCDGYRWVAPEWDPGEHRECPICGGSGLVCPDLAEDYEDDPTAYDTYGLVPARRGPPVEDPDA